MPRYILWVHGSFKLINCYALFFELGFIQPKTRKTVCNYLKCNNKKMIVNKHYSV